MNQVRPWLLLASVLTLGSAAHAASDAPALAWAEDVGEAADAMDAMETVAAGASEDEEKAAAASEAGKISMKVYHLEEVIVYAEAPQALGMVIELRGDELLNRGGGDVAHLLRLDPALTVTAGGKAETETRLRGMPGRATLILVDGRPVNPGYYGKVDLSMIAASGVAAVQVIKGPASAAYGPNAMGGVVNIITRSGFDTPGTNVGIRGGGDGLRQLSFGHSVRSGPLGLAFHGYEHHRDAFRLSRGFVATSIEDGGLRTGSGFRKVGGGLKIGYERDDHDIYTLTFDYHWSRREIPPTVYIWDSPTYRRFPFWMRYGASLSNQRSLGRELELVTVLSADGQHDRLIDYAGPSLDDGAINWDSRLENRSYGASVQLTGTAGTRNRFRTGASFRHDTMNKRPDVGELWDRHALGTGSLFLENRYTASNSIALTGGLQSSWHLAEQQEKRRLAICPLLSVRWKPISETALMATYSRAVRYPTLHRLYSVDSGNPDLLPESADKYELGIERHLLDRKLSAQAAWFHSDLTDMIDRPSSDRQYRNVDSATIRGIDVAVRSALSPLLQAEAGYTWMDRGVWTREVMRESPAHSFSLGFTVATPFGTTVRYDFAAQDERSSHVPERLHPAHRLQSLTIRQSVPRGVILHFEVFNIADAHFEEELGFPAPGRTLTFGFDWRH